MDSKFIRNFVIISHVDHGKSTLADRLFELTSKANVPQPQFLDQMELEREKGITIKLTPLRMECKESDLSDWDNASIGIPKNETDVTRASNVPANAYILNLIDTPGHVDFSDEVVRSLRAVEGAVLLVDAVKGVQAQTISNLTLAQKLNLVIIPVINKIDLPAAQVDKTREELCKLLPCSKDEVLEISAKLGTNIDKVIKAIIQRIPHPSGLSTAPLKTFIFDAVYDNYHGVIAYLKIEQGVLKSRQKDEVGVFAPEKKPVEKLSAGEIGYQITGIKELAQYRETVGYKKSQALVFANIFGDFPSLSKGLEQLKLNDASLTFKATSSKTLGQGFRCGFLGMLHLEIVLERLKREYNLNELVITSPTVNYRKEEEQTKEPWVSMNIIVPQEYFGRVWQLIKGLDGEHKSTNCLSKNKLSITYQTPLREIITDFYDRLKSATSGYGSMDYSLIDWRETELVQLDILIAKQKQEALSQLVPKTKAETVGREMVSSLKALIPPRQFPVAVQAAIGSKIIARETIKARRKDVTAPLYGGDYTRKRKLLEKQKKGKKKLALAGQIKIPPEIFVKLFQKRN